MQYFDTHAHIGLIYDDPIEQLLVCQEAKQAGVTRIISICNSLMDFKQVYENLKTMEHVFHAVGVSPSEVQNPGKDWHRTVEDAAKLPRVVAIGEIGLDYYHKFGDRKSQIELFIDQLDFAARLDLPVIVHNREAGKDVIDILRDRLPPAGGVLHCYSEDAEPVFLLRGEPHVPQRAQPARDRGRAAAGAHPHRERGSLHGARRLPRQAQQARVPALDLRLPGRDPGDGGRSGVAGGLRERLQVLQAAGSRLGLTAA
jgi:hypothetical protein